MPDAVVPVTPVTEPGSVDEPELPIEPDVPVDFDFDFLVDLLGAAILPMLLCVSPAAVAPEVDAAPLLMLPVVVLPMVALPAAPVLLWAKAKVLAVARMAAAMIDLFMVCS